MPMALPAVEDLSGSENEFCGVSESEAGSDASQLPLVGVGKRKRPALDDEISVRRLLGRQCLCSKWNCFQKFSREEDFQKLLAFRKQWANLHKLDQDKVETCPQDSCFFFFWEANQCLLFVHRLSPK